MRRRILFASSLAAGVLAVGLLGIAPAADTASAAAKKRDSSRSYVLESRRRYKRPRTQKIPLPVGPAYTYYDYPYYYARGHYPTHIGGYVYYYPPGVYSYGPTRRHKARR